MEEDGLPSGDGSGRSGSEGDGERHDGGVVIGGQQRRAVVGVVDLEVLGQEGLRPPPALVLDEKARLVGRKHRVFDAHVEFDHRRQLGSILDKEIKENVMRVCSSFPHF